MADHIWSVLCSRGILDKYTNNVTLVDVAEVLQIQLLEDIPEGQRGAVPISLFLVSLWRRSEYSLPEKTAARFLIETPDREMLTMSQMIVDLESHQRSRTFVGIATLPMPRQGIYAFHVELSAADQWVRVASIPLEVTVLSASDAPLPPHPVEQAGQAN